MRGSIFLIAIAAALLCGCAQQPPPEPRAFYRVDCRPTAGDAMMEQEFERVRAVCVSRSQAAAISGTASMPSGYGLGGAIAAGINKGITSNQISEATGNSCMAEQGFLFRTEAEDTAVCTAIRDQQMQRIAEAQRMSRKPMSRPIPPRAPSVQESPQGPRAGT